MPTITPRGYTNIERVENYLLIDVAQYFEDQVNEWIASIEDYIDQYCGRVFLAGEDAETRYFDGNGTTTLLVDDGTALEEIHLGRESGSTEFDDTGAGTDYYLYPANKAIFNRIDLKSHVFPCGRQNIAVKAKWGYSTAVPNDIQLAATILVAGVINFNSPETGEDIQSETIGRYSVTYRDRQGFEDYELAMKILDSYRTIEL